MLMGRLSMYSKKPMILVIGGPNGSGKSTTLLRRFGQDVEKLRKDWCYGI